MANLYIKAGFKEGKSYLMDSYVSVPFRITNVGQVKDDGSLYMMLGSSSPGLLDSDNHEIEIDIEKNSRFQLQTQSYQRLYNMKKGSSQITKISLAPNSFFCYVPHPVVPQENSIFRNRTVINLDKNCELILSEVVTCGRKNSENIYPNKNITKQSNNAIFDDRSSYTSDYTIYSTGPSVSQFIKKLKLKNS